MRRRLSQIFDYAAPVWFGSCCWLDAIFGYRPSATDEPEAV